MFKKIKNKYIGDKSFYRKYIILAVPMIIQNFITNFVSLLDNIMVGQLGTEQMTGVAIINQLMMVFALAIFGVTAAAGIYGAQFYGKGDKQGHMYTFRFRLYSSLLVAIIAIFIFATFGHELIDLYLTESSSSASLDLAHSSAWNYLLIMLIGLIPFALTQAYASILKETGETFVPMLAGLFGVILNIIFDWLLIFGIGPFPVMEIKGAAIATVMARFIECLIVMVWTHKNHHKNHFLTGAFTGIGLPMSLFGQIMKKGTPLILNEIMWSLGMTSLVQNYSVRGLDVIAAINIANTINNLFNIVFVQLGACIGIIVGQHLGAGELEEAKDKDNKMIAFSVACCTVMAIFMLLTRKLFPNLYNTSEDIKVLAAQFMAIQAIMMPFFSFSHCCYFTLRAGGKTFVTILFDSVFTWVVMVSTSFILTRFTGLDIVTIYAIVNATEFIKNFMGYKMVKSDVWLETII